MAEASGLLSSFLIAEVPTSSGEFNADVIIVGGATSLFDSQLNVTKTIAASEFDAQVCVAIEATQVSPSALIVNPTEVNGSGVIPFTASYSASGWASGEKNIVDYTWFFNDIETSVSEGQTIEYTHTTSGSFIVVLRVTDSDGFVGFDRRRILTYSGIALDLPELQISGIPLGGSAPLSVDFGASGGAFGGGAIHGYSWSFGHGKFSKRQVQSGVTYSIPGHFIPVCTLVDDRGVRMSDSLDIGVNN